MKNPVLCLATLISLTLMGIPSVRAESAKPGQGAFENVGSDRLGLARQLVAILLPTVGQDAMEGMKMGIMAHLDGIDDATTRAGLEADIEQSMVVAAPIMGRHVTELNEAFALAYARQYDSTELRQIIAFAQSPAGRHFLTQNEALDRDPAVLAVQDRMMADVLPVFAHISRKLCLYQAARGAAEAKCAAA